MSLQNRSRGSKFTEKKKKTSLASAYSRASSKRVSGLGSNSRAFFKEEMAFC